MQKHKCKSTKEKHKAKGRGGDEGGQNRQTVEREVGGGGGKGREQFLTPLSWVFFKSPDNGWLVEEDLKVVSKGGVTIDSKTKYKAKAHHKIKAEST